MPPQDYMDNSGTAATYIAMPALKRSDRHQKLHEIEPSHESLNRPTTITAAPCRPTPEYSVAYPSLAYRYQTRTSSHLERLHPPSQTPRRRRHRVVVRCSVVPQQASIQPHCHISSNDFFEDAIAPCGIWVHSEVEPPTSTESKVGDDVEMLNACIEFAIALRSDQECPLLWRCGCGFRQV